jgi:hypothetical protein
MSPKAPYYGSYQDISMATNWIGSYERKYLRHTHFHIKRSLRFAELYPASPPLSNASGDDEDTTLQEPRLYVPRLSRERLQNEADSLRFVAMMTDIPVPKVLALFEDFGSTYLVTEMVPGVEMSRLREEDKRPVYRQLAKYMTTLHTLRSNILGGPGGQVIVPRPVMRATHQDEWNLMKGNPVEGDLLPRYVFCHGDLSEHNVIVNPETLEVRAILDWEHAGFWPEFFEGEIYTRVGPRASWNEDCPVRVGRMLGFLQANEVRMGACGMDEYVGTEKGQTPDGEAEQAKKERDMKVHVTVEVETKEEWIEKGEDAQEAKADNNDEETSAAGSAADTPIEMIDEDSNLDQAPEQADSEAWELMETVDGTHQTAEQDDKTDDDPELMSLSDAEEVAEEHVQ